VTPNTVKRPFPTCLASDRAPHHHSRIRHASLLLQMRCTALASRACWLPSSAQRFAGTLISATGAAPTCIGAVCHIRRCLLFTGAAGPAVVGVAQDTARSGPRLRCCDHHRLSPDSPIAISRHRARSSAVTQNSSATYPELPLHQRIRHTAPAQPGPANPAQHTTGRGEPHCWPCGTRVC